jgi:prepilin-type N-terminal cleavage/methylation domain-containing protein
MGPREHDLRTCHDHDRPFRRASADTPERGFTVLELMMAVAAAGRTAAPGRDSSAPTE